MEIKLSILIATTFHRNEIIKPLLKTLNKQIENKLVELIINEHPTDCIGKKRNDLLGQAKGLYCVFIDSDDMVPTDYVSKILSAVKTNPDCVGIEGFMTTNGRKRRKWFISKDYGYWYTKRNEYFRTPNHISPIKTELAKQAGFPEISFGEDAEFSKRVLPLLKSEVKIKGYLYHYDYKKK